MIPKVIRLGILFPHSLQRTPWCTLAHLNLACTRQKCSKNSFNKDSKKFSFLLTQLSFCAFRIRNTSALNSCFQNKMNKLTSRLAHQKLRSWVLMLCLCTFAYWHELCSTSSSRFPNICQTTGFYESKEFYISSAGICRSLGCKILLTQFRCEVSAYFQNKTRLYKSLKLKTAVLQT